MAETLYKGVPLHELEIETLHWTEERADHIRTRSIRKGPGETNLESEWATEAALDPYRLVRLASPRSSPSNEALEVIGFSRSVPPNGAVLKVWIWSETPAESPIWNGGSACVADSSEANRYFRMRSDHEGT